MVNTLSIVFAMHQWQYTLKLIQYQISDSWSNAKTTYRMAIVSCRGFLSFFVMFGLWITVKLHYKALQRQLSQGCTIFIDSFYVICKNYGWLCRNLWIMRSDAIFDRIIVLSISETLCFGCGSSSRRSVSAFRFTVALFHSSI